MDQTTRRLLRLCYWLGAVTDGLAIIPMVVPPVGVALFVAGGREFHADYRYAMYLGAALMAGWTVLLVWADRDPLARRGILLITVFPVLTGIVAAQLYGVTGGLLSAGKTAPLFVHQSVVATLFLYTYVRACRVARRRP